MYLFFRHAVLLVAGVHLAVVELFSVVDLIRSAHDMTINTVDEQRRGTIRDVYEMTIEISNNKNNPLCSEGT